MWRQSVWRKLSMWGVMLLAASGCSASSDSDRSPATPSEAAKVLDLTVFPLVDGAESAGRRLLARLSYKAPGGVKAIYASQQKQLLDAQWTEMPNSFVTDESASGTFTRDGYALSLTVSPVGDHEVMISFQNHGNVPLAKLPVPPGAKSLYAGPISVLYVTSAPVDETRAACRKLLEAQGWQPYGKAGEAQYFKQNGVRLLVDINAAPAQGGKTMISYTSEMLSIDLLAPADAVDLQYTDQTSSLLFDSATPPDDLAGYYREKLKPAGWEATTEKPISVEKQQMMIFRNPAGDMLTLTMQPRDDKHRVTLLHQTAAEVQEIERKIKEKQAEAAEKQKAAESDPPPAK